MKLSPLVVTIASIAAAENAGSQKFAKRDCAQPVLLQAVQPYQEAQPCVQQISPAPVQLAVSQPCQQPAQAVMLQQAPVVTYQQPVAQPIYYQPQPQPQYYQPPPQYYPNYQQDYPGEGFFGSGCYSNIGNQIAGAAGRFMRYIACPWSFFADQADTCNADNEYGNGYGSYSWYSQPQPQYYQSPYQYQQPAVMYQQPQQPQGQWYTTVVPVTGQQNAVVSLQQTTPCQQNAVVPIQQAVACPQNALIQGQALQPVHQSLVPDYGLPNGYGIATTEACS